MTTLIVLDPPAEGGCLCGAIRYRVDGEVEDSAYCHCRTCQRQSGAPVVAWFALPPAPRALAQGSDDEFVKGGDFFRTKQAP